MPTFKLPEPYVGGPAADPVENSKDVGDRFDAIQRNFEGIESFLSALGTRFYWGSGTPENAVTAPPGSLYLDYGGGAGVTLYIKEANTDDTGWVGK